MLSNHFHSTSKRPSSRVSATARIFRNGAKESWGSRLSFIFGTGLPYCCVCTRHHPHLSVYPWGFSKPTRHSVSACRDCDLWDSNYISSWMEWDQDKLVGCRTELWALVQQTMEVLLHVIYSYWYCNWLALLLHRSMDHRSLLNFNCTDRMDCNFYRICAI